MATVTEIAASPATEPAELIPYRLSADDYFQMVDADIIPSRRRVWLWEGQLFEKMAKNLPHSLSTAMLTTVLLRNIPDGWSLWPENPVRLTDQSVPLPDMTVIRGAYIDYANRGRGPTADDVALVIEVADTSIRKDTGRMRDAYARALIPVYWVVNLVARRVEVYSRPVVGDGPARYEIVETYSSDGSVPLVLDGREVARIAGRDILPAEANPQ